MNIEPLHWPNNSPPLPCMRKSNRITGLYCMRFGIMGVCRCRSCVRSLFEPCLRVPGPLASWTFSSPFERVTLSENVVFPRGRSRRGLCVSEGMSAPARRQDAACPGTSAQTHPKPNGMEPGLVFDEAPVCTRPTLRRKLDNLTVWRRGGKAFWEMSLDNNRDSFF